MKIDPLAGQAIGRYLVKKQLGSGAMGEVYLAEDPRLKRTVALKRIAPQLQADPEYRERFLREAERASGVKSAHVAAIHDVFEENGQIFLVMEHVEGVRLREQLREPVKVENFLKVAAQAAEALESAHREGIVHCDIKPENIMITPEGAVKVLDFGVAKRLPRSDESTTMERGQSGTPSYMAPEVLLNHGIDGRADLFSLGIVFYEMLTGRHPFQAASFAETIEGIVKKNPAPIRKLNPRVPEGVEAIVMRMLAKKPEDRYASAGDLLKDLQTAESVADRPAGGSKPMPRWIWPTLLAAAIAAGAILYWQRREPAAAGKAPRQLAVLPFNASGGDAGTVAFSNGLTETLTTKLTQLREDDGLMVVPSSEMRGESVRTAEQARKLFGANLVLEGSLAQSGGLVRINYTLVDAGSRQPLHAEVITESASDPFGVEDKVVDSVLKALDVELSGQERATIEKRGTSAPEAYDYYLRGIGYLHESQKAENTQNAIAVFQHALEQDPKYALAWAGLGQAYWQQYDNTQERDWVGKAKEACKQAESLDSGLTATHVCLGTVLNGSGEYDRAAEEFQRATEIDPTSDDAVRQLADAYMHQGKPQEAEAAYLTAIRLRPQSWLAYDRLGIFYTAQTRYDDAAKAFEQVIRLAPDSYQGYNNLGGTYLAQGKYEEAIRQLTRSAEVEQNATVYSNIGAAYVYLKRYPEAIAAYEKAVNIPDAEYAEWGNLAEAYYWGPDGRQRAGGAYRKAIAMAEEKLKVNPKDAEVLSWLGLYHAMLQEKAAALRSMNQALGAGGDNPEILFNAAKTENQLGEKGKALEYLQKAIASGYSKFFARDDPEFGGMRGDERFRRVVE
jgi:serine/threonine-protein kinase